MEGTEIAKAAASKLAAETLDYERTFGSGVCSLSCSTMTKYVRCSWSKSVSASITSLGTIRSQPP